MILSHRTWRAYRRWSMPGLRKKAAINRARVARFVAEREPQSEADFFRACFPDGPVEWIRWTRAMRYAIARLGRVHPRFIRSGDHFQDLVVLPGWCEMGDAFFDVYGLIMLMEHSADLSFRDEELARLPNVDSYDEVPIIDFVRQATELCARKATVEVLQGPRI